MHNFLKIYYFIDEFNSEEIKKLNKNIALIYRNYKENYDVNSIKKLKNFCKKNKRELFISNNLKIALKLDLDGIYIPAFNKLRNYKNLNTKKKFKIIGSAHNLPEIKDKENQGCSSIFIAPLFKTKKSNFFLEIAKFNLLAKYTKKVIIALGGINNSNVKKINLTNSKGFASISWIKKNRPK
tara:strand:+ start:255 stop:800 length:546 start_codon:yes stop_codon:yes gene_type:complete